MGIARLANDDNHAITAALAGSGDFGDCFQLVVRAGGRI
jgi:hypothetical protein